MQISFDRFQKLRYHCYCLFNTINHDSELKIFFCTVFCGHFKTEILLYRMVQINVKKLVFKIKSCQKIFYLNEFFRQCQINFTGALATHKCSCLLKSSTRGYGTTLLFTFSVTESCFTTTLSGLQQVASPSNLSTCPAANHSLTFSLTMSKCCFADPLLSSLYFPGVQVNFGVRPSLTIFKFSSLAPITDSKNCIAAGSWILKLDWRSTLPSQLLSHQIHAGGRRR